MTFGQSVALHVSPLLLRLGLAAVFIYAGTGKLFYHDMPVSGEAAAYLANAGLIDAPPRPAVEGPVDGAADPAPVPEEAPAEAPGEGEEGEGDDASEDDGALTGADGGMVVIGVADEAVAGAYTASDFGEPVLVHRRLGLVLMMHGAAVDGWWPTQLSGPRALSVLSWIAVLTEFVGGWLVLLGFLTRVWALGFVSAMGVALWLTQISPSIGADGAFLGMLPPLQIGDAEVWTKAWQTMQLQFVLLMASLALALSGPGRVSLDALILRRGEPGPEGPRVREGAGG